MPTVSQSPGCLHVRHLTGDDIIVLPSLTRDYNRVSILVSVLLAYWMILKPLRRSRCHVIQVSAQSMLQHTCWDRFCWRSRRDVNAFNRRRRRPDDNITCSRPPRRLHYVDLTFELLNWKLAHTRLTPYRWCDVLPESRLYMCLRNPDYRRHRWLLPWGTFATFFCSFSTPFCFRDRSQYGTDRQRRRTSWTRNAAYLQTYNLTIKGRWQMIDRLN